MVAARIRRFESIVVLAFAWSLILCRSALGGITIRVPQDYPTITEAFVWATDGDTIVVSPGLYVENVNFLGKNVILRSTDPTSPPVVAATIIDGNQKRAVVTFAGTETTGCLLAGFTIRNGYGYAGGIHGNGTRARIEYNTITGNSASFGGGLRSCNGTIRNNTITGNSGGRQGGGGLSLCDGIIENNLITGNNASYYDGGGLYFCDGTIRNNTITGNSAEDCGGGLYYCDGIIENNLITGNSAEDYGGGLAYCNGTIRNNTITGNTASREGGGLYDCTGVIVNCIIWGNSAPIYSQISYHSIPAYSCIEGFTVGGGGNIGLNPLFVGPNDFHLRSGSPCIDAGTNTNCPATDMDGNPRPLDGNGDGHAVCDMGAYEFYVPPPPTAVPTAAWILYE